MNSMDHINFYNDHLRNILPSRREICHICQPTWLFRSRIVSSLESMIGCLNVHLTLLPSINFQFLWVTAVGLWNAPKIGNGRNGYTSWNVWRPRDGYQPGYYIMARSNNLLLFLRTVLRWDMLRSTSQDPLRMTGIFFSWYQQEFR